MVAEGEEIEIVDEDAGETEGVLAMGDELGDDTVAVLGVPLLLLPLIPARGEVLVELAVIVCVVVVVVDGDTSLLLLILL